MRRGHALSLVLLLCFVWVASQKLASSHQEQLRILVIGAHPDDAEKAGGTAAKWSATGHVVKLVSLTNGDAGHFSMGGGLLAVRRQKEAQCAGEVIGVEYVCLDNHDGELLPTLENRRKVIRLIREFEADVVISHRPNDYHPDHRYTAILVQDAAYMVTVPNVVAQTPHLRHNPVFLYMADGFSKPNPFQPDVVVDIGEVIEKKIDMYDCHESQMYEWLPYNSGRLDEVPKDRAKRRQWLAKQRMARDRSTADRYRDLLVELYGEDKGMQVEYAEAFEVSEYGAGMTEQEIKRVFPF